MIRSNMSFPYVNKNGLNSCSLYQDIEDKNEMILIEEWKAQRFLNNHLGSDIFGVLAGAVVFLSEDPQIKISVVSSMLDIEKKRIRTLKKSKSEKKEEE